MPIHFTGKGKTDIIDIVHAVSIDDRLEADALVYPLRPDGDYFNM